MGPRGAKLRLECGLEAQVQPKSFEVAKTRKSSSRAGESSSLRVARAPKISLRGAKLRLKCGLESQVAPKRLQTALAVRLGALKCVQLGPKCVSLGPSESNWRGNRVRTKRNATNWRGNWVRIKRNAHQGKAQQLCKPLQIGLVLLYLSIDLLFRRPNPNPDAQSTTTASQDETASRGFAKAHQLCTPRRAAARPDEAFESLGGRWKGSWRALRGHLEATWRTLGGHLGATWSPSRAKRRPEAPQEGRSWPQETPRGAQEAPS